MTQVITIRPMLEEDFREYIIPESKLEISHPVTWKISPAGLPATDSILLAIMFKQSEGSRPSVTLSVRHIPPDVDNAPADAKEYVEANIIDLKSKHEDYRLIESAPSTLGGNIAHRVTYDLGGAKHFSDRSNKGK